MGMAEENCDQEFKSSMYKKLGLKEEAKGAEDKKMKRKHAMR
jgi:hypothetical protein